MIDKKALQLLKELLLLHESFGSDSFQQLAKLAKEGFLGRELEPLLEIISSTAARQTRPVKTRKMGPPRTEKPGTETKIIRQELLPLCALLQEDADSISIRDFREILDRFGGTAPSKATRKQLAERLLHAMEERPVEDIAEAILKLKSVNPRGSNTLEGWADVIIKDRPKDGG